ncbi:hypothetical protein G6F56_014220 [Rhizopus delemar]|nr:hypothetical protein G6F56_014220 [Rhizopus delemar]
MPSGIAENELVMLRVSGIGEQTNAMARTREDLAALRAIPGVTSATIINQVPFRNGSSSSSISREAAWARWESTSSQAATSFPASTSSSRKPPRAVPSRRPSR